ncbi:MAG TPA: hypothetical protein VG944_01045, partial [Fimbriimonas sp.]|nr:hypothetical protein [Fimbriimonas sp.]
MSIRKSAKKGVMPPRITEEAVRKPLAMLAVLGLVLLSAQAAFGQADNPTLKGNNRRVGHNSDPVRYNSGATVLQWVGPPLGPTGAGASLTVDDSFRGDDTVNGQASLANGSVPNTAWNSVLTTNVAQEAFSPFIRHRTAPQDILEDYAVANSTPSSAASQTTPATGTASTFTWRFDTGGSGVPQSYALYVWVPQGPMQFAANTLPIFPQRYYVYTITYGNGLQTFTDVVDTYAGGTGFVRLGNGGLPTNAVFPSDGTHSITITLYNTVPRNANGSLTTTGPSVVYADAAMATPIGAIFTASPVSAYQRDSGGLPVVDTGGDLDVSPYPTGQAYFARITAAYNSVVPVSGGTGVSTNYIGHVTNYQMNPDRWQVPAVKGVPTVPTALWNWQPSPLPVVSVNTFPGNTTSEWTSDTTNPHFQGANYLSCPIDNTIQTALYTPANLAAGPWTIYVYLPGDGGGEHYTTVNYRVRLGATVVASVNIDQSVAGGWVPISTTNGSVQAFYQTDPVNAPLTVLERTPGAAQTGRLAYANAVRFVGPTNQIISSTPVHAQVHIRKSDGTTPLTQVVIVADETGKIHCLDEEGNGDGTTTEYWSYPSTPDPNNANWIDPNLTAGIDGPSTSTVPSAIMPTGFNLSSALVQHIASDNTDRLYIASTNGRIYCIDMAGRGDYDATKNRIGSTPRIWSYPNDYPLATVPSNLGQIRGSLVYGDDAAGANGPTIFVPSPQGRIFALDAVGSTTNRSTTIKWTYPALTSPNLPPIEMTPSLAFGNLYFGTLMDPNNNGPGRVYAISAHGNGSTPPTTNVIWSFNGVTNGSTNGNNVVSEQLGDFVAGPATAPATMLNDNTGAYAIAPQDSVYFLNGNTYLYGFNAHTGTLLTDTTGTLQYHTNELGVTSDANLGFNWITTFDRNLALRQMPVVMVPTQEGHFYGLFANVDDYNKFTRAGVTSAYLSAWGYGVLGPNTTSLAFSNQRMIGADSYGHMYVWDNNSAGRGYEEAGPPPGTAVAAPNTGGPAAFYQYPKVAIVTADTYKALRTVAATGV